MTRRQVGNQEWDKTISLNITKDSIKRNYIYVPRCYRHLFPLYKKEDFSLKTGVGTFLVHITSEKDLGFGLKAREDSDAGTKIYGKKKILEEWYKEHPELKEGDTIIIKEIESKKVYELGIVRWS